MTMCNMAIEAGARAGMVAVDERTIDYLEGRPFAPDRRACGTARSRTGARCTSDDGAKFDTTSRDRRGDDAAAGHVGHVAGDGGRRSTAACPIPTSETRSDAARGHRARADLHGARSRTRRSPTSASTRCSSARAPTRASRTCARPRRSRAGAHVAEQRQARDGRAGLGAGEGAGRSAKASTASSATPASNGASPAARCASR